MSDYRKNSKRGQQSLDIGYGHLQPQAVEVEKAVLGALIVFARKEAL